MTTPRSLPIATLSYDSPAFRAHEPHVARIDERATELGVLRNSYRGQIFDDVRRALVCDRGQGDDRASVARTYFGTAIRVQRIESDERAEAAQREWAADVRALLYDVLAVQYSITEAPADKERDPEMLPVEGYRELVEQLEEYCRDSGVPSVLPNLQSPSSLFSRIRQAQYAPRTEALRGFWRRLVDLAVRHDRMFHAVVTALQRHATEEEAAPLLDSLQYIEDAARERGDELSEMFAANPALADTYVQGLFEIGRHEEAAAIVERLALPDLLLHPNLAEKYLRSLMALGRMDGVFTLYAEQPRLRDGAENLRKCFGIACERRAGEIYGSGDYEGAIRFLEENLGYELGSNGRDNVNFLCLQSLLGIDDHARTRRFLEESMPRFLRRFTADNLHVLLAYVAALAATDREALRSYAEANAADIDGLKDLKRAVRQALRGG